MSKYVLIVDDNRINREIIKKTIAGKYLALEAENGRIALEMLEENKDRLSAVILDLVMPEMDGYEFLQEVNKIDPYSDVPILVITGDVSAENEERCLELGAADFIQKPYNRTKLLLRLENAVSRRHVEYLERIKYLSERDELTGIFNKHYFAGKTKEMIEKNTDTTFALVRLDLDQFRLFNSFFGVQQGDNLLRHIGAILQEENELIGDEFCTYARAESDVFLICLPYMGKEALIERMNHWNERVAEFNPHYCFEISMGVYIIEDRSIDVETMYAYASTAARTCKNRYMKVFEFYDESMSLDSLKEQILLNDIQNALEEEQFVPYIQPKYNLEMGVPYGGEALIRWQHPTKGLIPPGDFIPVFEKNGFIVELDFYMWESVCKLLRKWIDEGKNPDPISVNLSRVSMYNAGVADTIKDLVDKYNLPPTMLNLEITESAYMDNPELMKQIIASLKSKGFVIMMDDFGSGYSSLNTLKEIDVDILKIDMKFLPTGQTNGKSEKILVSVIKMAGWIGLPVVVEGVETEDQINFLKNIGCEYVQGYYYSRPVPVSEYELLMDKTTSGNKAQLRTEDEETSMWGYNPYVENILKSISVPVALFEYSIDKSIRLIRTNAAFEEAMGYGEFDLGKFKERAELLPEKSKRTLWQSLDRACTEDSCVECDYERPSDNLLDKCWYRVRTQLLKKLEDRCFLCVVFTNVTTEKILDYEIQRLKAFMKSKQGTTNIVVAGNKESVAPVINNVFTSKCNVLGANSSGELVEILCEHEKDNNHVDMIIVDNMPLNEEQSQFTEIKESLNAGKDGKSSMPTIVVSSDILRIYMNEKKK